MLARTFKTFVLCVLAGHLTNQDQVLPHLDYSDSCKIYFCLKIHLNELMVACLQDYFHTLCTKKHFWWALKWQLCQPFVVVSCPSVISFVLFSRLYFLFDLFFWNDWLPWINLVIFIAFWPSLVNTALS